jgi:hypothetical protein
VHIFHGCERDFFDALVIKLQPCICTAGVYVFYDGEAGHKMYFVKHGMAEVLKNSNVVFTFKEGDYFGEIALLSEMSRTADVIRAPLHAPAVTNTHTVVRPMCRAVLVHTCAVLLPGARRDRLHAALALPL